MKVKELKEEYNKAKNKVKWLNDVRKILHDLSCMNHNPVDFVQWIHIDKIKSNDYNPNEVADREMELLYISVKNDKYTQPIVTVYDKEIKKYIIIDGFHRYSVLKFHNDIYGLNNGYLPIVVLDKSMKDRMASTIRHNRARGKHKIDGMGKLVFRMLDEGLEDKDICSELGMEAEELVKLKHVTGFSKLFENVEYRNAWKTRKQLVVEKKYKEGTQ